MIYSKKAIVWDFSILQLTENKFWCRGVVLKGNKPWQNKKNNTLRNALSVLKTYFRPVYANQEIKIHLQGKTITTETDARGRFEIILETNSLEVKIMMDDSYLNIENNYVTTFTAPSGYLDIISDIDDTILVSNTSNLFKRIKTLLFFVPEKRDVIVFTQKIFQEWQEVNPRLFYVSKSESNLYGILTAFIKYNSLPKGLLILTPYLNFTQLIKGYKPENFKLDAVRFLIKNTRSEKYVLVGDDSQKDMFIYTIIANEFPELILKIYIRQTGKKVSKSQSRMWQNLTATGISASYFLPEHEDAVLEEIKKLKLKLI
ncbi:App1 family protein [Tamlana sp. 2_MG-2023]|uniref:phosphatase domain-containing protein n=1 Tax=unclassified Tamlana TaxID=2614803 RepID=UPI0026E2141A|nr:MULTISPECIES: App1 family protein [unclassified Tamlana]MDO6759549.1 App1 family protein [Tamlana sp. 2_MG-2023]MDO6790312.1 App1 family protein [Tamlana sp. 1_MG-2023]